MPRSVKTLLAEWEKLKVTGWRCAVCGELNNQTRKVCWHCLAPPEIRNPR